MSLSVIIPTLNEAACLPETLRELRRQRPREIIVVDGGSTDDTLDAARTADVVLSAPRGRARQMNAGAPQAAGDLLLFLHADCVLQAGALEAAVQTLRRPGVIAGCFTMQVRAAGI